MAYASVGQPTCENRKQPKLTLDEFSVYTRTDNPFRLSGTVDFADMANMMLDLRMVARNYELINASRKKNSVSMAKSISTCSPICEAQWTI